MLAQSVSIDSSYVKAHRSAHGRKGGEGAGHRTLAQRPDHQTHAVTDLLVLPAILMLTAGNVADITMVVPPKVPIDYDEVRYKGR